MPHPTRRILARAVFPLSTCLTAPLVSAQTVISWANPTTGQWGTPSNWSAPYYPNNGNPPGTTYDVDIAATGASYLVTFAPMITIAVDRLTVNSPDAEFYHFSSTLVTPRIDVTRGTYAFAGGTIRGATLSVDSSAAFRVVRPGPSDGFDNVTVAAGAVTVSHGGYLAVHNGLTIADGASVVLENNSPWNETYQTTLAPSGTISGTGQILFGGTAGPSYNNNLISGSSLTFAPGITIRTASTSGTVGAPGSTFLNQGTIAADVPGLEVKLGGTWTNTGSLHAANGGTLTLGGTWTNTGQIVVDNALVNLGGTFAASSLAGLTRSGTSTVTLTGTLANAGSTLALNDPSAPLLLGPGATIVGGTVTAPVPGASLNNATLDGVTLDGDFAVPYNAYNASLTVIRNGVTLPAGRTLSLAATASPSGVLFDGSQALAGAGQVVLDGSASLNTIGPRSNADRLTFAPSLTVRTGTGGGTLTNVDNRGVISAETPKQSITLAGSWSNAGTLHASNGGILLLTGALNPATFGTTISDSGGLVTLAGPLDLAGATLARSGPAATLGLGNNAVISNATLATSDGASFAATAAGQNVQFATVSLNNVTLAGTLSLGSRTSVRFNSDLTLDHANVSLADLGESTNNGASLSTPGSYALAGTGEITFDGTTGHNAVLSYGGTLSIGPAVTIRTGTASGTVGPVISVGALTVVNYGTLSAQTPGQSLTLTGNNWSNLGTLRAANGATLNLGGTFSPASIGTLLVSPGGTVNVAGTLSLANSTLSLSSSLPLGLTAGGTISGGTVASSDATPLLARGGASTLSAVTLDTPLSVLPAASVTFSSSLANQPITASGTGASLVLAGSWSNNSHISVSAGATLNLGGAPSTIGPISLADSTLNLTGSYTAAQFRTLSLSNPTVRIPAGGNLNVTGDSFRVDASTGNLQFAGGRITGGTVSADPGSQLVANPATSSTLDGVTLAADLTLGFGATVTILNGLTLSGGHVGLTNDSVLSVSGTAAVTGSGEISFDGSPPLDPSGPVVFMSTPPAVRPSGSSSTLTIGPGVTVRTNTSGGTVGIATRPLANNGTISAQSPAKAVTLYGSAITNAGTLRAANGSTLVVSTPSFTNAGTITVDPTSTLLLTGASATPNGTIDLAGTALLDYTAGSPSPIDAVRQQLSLGLTGTTGIILPSAPSNPTRALAYAEASQLLHLTGTQTATYAGQTVDATTLLLKPALQGDANLDGAITPDDYALLDRSFALHTPTPHWTDGDFNYDGQVDAQDYLLIDRTLGQAQGFSPGVLSQRESQFGPAYVQALLTSIPEPSSLACLFAGFLFARRRNRAKNTPILTVS